MFINHKVGLKRNITSLEIYRSLNFTLISVTNEFSTGETQRCTYAISVYLRLVYIIPLAERVSSEHSILTRIVF